MIIHRENLNTSDRQIGEDWLWLLSLGGSKKDPLFFSFDYRKEVTYGHHTGISLTRDTKSENLREGIFLHPKCCRILTKNYSKPNFLDWSTFSLPVLSPLNSRRHAPSQHVFPEWNPLQSFSSERRYVRVDSLDWTRTNDVRKLAHVFRTSQWWEMQDGFRWVLLRCFFGLTRSRSTPLPAPTPRQTAGETTAAGCC